MLDLTGHCLIEPFRLRFVNRCLSLPPLPLSLMGELEFRLVKPHKHTLQLAERLFGIDRAKVDFDLLPKLPGSLLPLFVPFLCLLGCIRLLIALSLRSLHLEGKG